MLKKTLMMSILFLLTIWNFASASTGLAFLEIGGGARATGMGEAFTAVVDDPTSLFWNPAGTASLTKRQALLTHNEWLQGINNEFIAVVFPTSRGNWGLSLILNNVNGIERRTKATAEPLAEFSAHDLAFGLTYAKSIGRKILVGLTCKYLHEKIYIESASGFGIDIGMTYLSPLSGLSFGAVVQNIGKTNKLREERIVLPTTLRLGVAYAIPNELFGGKGLAAIDVVKVSEEDVRIHFGGEYLVFDRVAFRAGYQTGYDEKGLSAGFGIGARRFVFDYAFVPYGSDLGNVHRFSFRVDF